MEEERLIRLEEKIKVVASDMCDVKDSLKDIADSLKTLAVLEEKHNTISEGMKRAFTAIDKHADRLDDIEKALPYLNLASGWLFKGILFVMGILGAAAMIIVLKGGIR